MYLGEKTKKFMPNNDLKSKSELYSWLMFFETGIGPYSGQSVHFQHMAPEKIKYAINRYTYEAERHYNILNDRLANMSICWEILIQLLIWLFGDGLE